MMKLKMLLALGVFLGGSLLTVGEVFAKKDKKAEVKKVYRNEKVLKKLWGRSLKSGLSSKQMDPELSSPVLGAQGILVGTQGAVFYALSPESGKSIWEYKNEEPISTTAAYGNGVIAYVDLGGYLRCLRETDGSSIWQNYVGLESLSQPVIAGNAVIVVLGEQIVAAYSLADGHVIWQKKLGEYVRRMTMRGHSAVTLDGGKVYVGLANGHVYALSAASGEVLWDRALGQPLRTFRDIDGNIVVAGDSLLVTGYFGMAYRLEKSTGRIIWDAEVSSAVAPAVQGDVVIVAGNDDKLYGFDWTTGRNLWINELNDEVLSAPVVVSGRVFVSTLKGKAFVVDPANGDKVQTVAVGDGSITPPIVVGDRVYLLSSSADLIAFGTVGNE